MEVSNGQLIANEEVFTMLQLLVQVSDHGAQVVNVVGLACLIKTLLEEHDANELGNEVVGVVDERVTGPHVVVLNGVVSELATNKSEDGE